MPGTPLRKTLGIAVPVLLAVVCFQKLIAAPDALLVDGARASVDHAGKPSVRAVGNDLTCFGLPRFLAVARRIEDSGSVPLWDDSGFGGRPLVGNPQAGLFYPPVWFAWWWGRPSALGWLTVGHLIWAGLGAFTLARALGLSRWASAVAAGCFEGSPYLLAHTFEGHYPHVWSVSWYPWAFWAFLRARDRRPSGLLALPVVLAVSMLTGHPQEWYYLVLALGCWAVGDAVLAVVRERGSGRGGGRRAVVGLAGWCGLLGLSLALCGVEIVPGLAVQPWLLKDSAIPIGRINHYYLHSTNLLQLISPFALGGPHDYFGHDNYWETVCSAGLAALLLAVWGLVAHPDRRARWGLGTLLAISVALACGRKAALFTLAYKFLPGMNRFRAPSRTLFLASLAVALLAGLGVDALGRLDVSARGWTLARTWLRRVVVVLAVVMASSWLIPAGPAGTDPGPGGPVDSRAARALGRIGRDGVVWSCVGTLLLVAWLPGGAGPGMGPRRLAFALGLLALGELGAHGNRLIRCSTIDRFLSAGPGPDQTRAALSGARGSGRVAASPRALPDLVAAVEGLSKTNVNDRFQIQHAAYLYERLYPFLEDLPRECPDREGPLDEAVETFRRSQAKTALDRMGVRCLATTRPTGLPGVDEYRNVEGFWIGWNAGALPRAYVVPRAVPESASQTPLTVWLGGVDPRAAVRMPEDPLGAGDRQPYTAALWRASAPDQVVVEVRTVAPGLLVVATTWMPGWSARVDGREEPVLRGDGWLQVVPLRKAGDHRVLLRYEPPGLAMGAALSLGGALAWTGLALGLAWRTRASRMVRPRGLDAPYWTARAKMVGAAVALSVIISRVCG